MRFEQLLFLTEVHRSHSITVACEQLHVTRQALSSALKCLERELDAQLLIRTVKGVSLTEKGYEVLTFAHDILERQDTFYQSFYEQHAESPVQGALNLMMLNPLRAMILPELLTTFSKKHPGLVFTIETHPIDEMIQLLDADQTDIVFSHVFTDAFIDVVSIPQHMHFHPLFECKPFVWCSKQSPLSKVKSIAYDQINQHPTIVDEKLDQSIFLSVLKANGRPNIAVSLEGNNVYLLEKYLEDNTGILWDYSIDNDHSIYRFLTNNPQLQKVQLTHCPYQAYGGYILKKDKPISPLLLTLIKYLNDTFAL